LAASLAILVLGSMLRLAVRPVDITAVSAAVLSILLWLGVWLAGLLVLRPRGAFVVGAVAMLLLDIAALPAPSVAPFDDRTALHRTDQQLTLRVAPGQSELVVLVEPVFSGAAPRFSLSGEVGGTRVEWSCTWRHGLQQLVLPVPASGDVHLQVQGDPARDGDYLLVYTSSAGLAPSSATTASSTCSATSVLANRGSS